MVQLDGLKSLLQKMSHDEVNSKIFQLLSGLGKDFNTGLLFFQKPALSEANCCDSGRTALATWSMLSSGKGCALRASVNFWKSI